VGVVALALWSGRIAAPARTLALALAVVCLLDPWAVLQPGFWLSFGAVALIFHVGAGWTQAEPLWRQWVRVQWAITAGLAPAALFLFAQVSVSGPLANALAIPLVSAVITPLVLAAAVLPVDALLHPAQGLVEWLLAYLEWCAALPAALWQQHVPPLWATLLALCGVVWLLLPHSASSVAQSGGTCCCQSAAGNAAHHSRYASSHSTSHCARCSSASTGSTAAASASGVITPETSGMASALASGPDTDTCANRNNAAGASPTVIAHCTRTHCRQRGSAWVQPALTWKISATAPNESQNPGCSTAQGSSRHTTASARASVRAGEAMRPDHRASATTLTI
jgi:hypothetical protein